MPSWSLRALRRPFLLAFALGAVLTLRLPAPARAQSIVPLPGLPTDSQSSWKWRYMEARHGLRTLVNEVDPADVVDPESPELYRTQGGATGVDGTWDEIPPPALWLHTTVYDPLRDRLVVFGGISHRGAAADLWTLELSGSPRWQRLTTAGPGPSARSLHSAIYDPAGDRMIVFGGYDGAYRNDVWALSLSGTPTWTQVDAGSGPSPRDWHVAVHDPVRGRMIVYGGTNGSQRFGDVWALSLSGTPQWAALAPTGTGPGSRSTLSAVYDAPRDRVLLYGGIDAGGAVRNDVWALSLAGNGTWTALSPLGTPPSPRNGSSVLYDPVRQRLVLFAGGTGAPNLNDSWSLSLAGTPAWTQLAPQNAPSGRQFHTAVYDPIGDRMLVFGGSNGPILSGTWALSLSATEAWIPLSGTRRRGHLAIHDEPRHRMVVFGGDDAVPLNDVWELALVSSTQNWLKLNPSGTPPLARAFHTGVYDPRRDRLVVFGGRTTQPLNDTWELTFSGTLAWRQLLPAGTPPPARIDHVAVYDPVRRRMLVIGGSGGVGSVLSDVWSLSLSGTPTWTSLSPGGGSPEPRGGAVAVYDPGGDRVLLYGGYDRNLLCLSDLWALSLSDTPTWTRLLPMGGSPPARLSAAAVYDPQRARMLVNGGTDLVDYFSDTWELALDGTPMWRLLAPSGTLPLSRADHKAIYDPLADRVVLYGGDGLGGGLLNDTWSLQFTPTVDVSGPPVAAARLLAPYPNPMRASTRFEASSPGGGALEVAIYDVGGRRVRRLSAVAAGEGARAAAWDGRDDAGARVPAGVYFYQVRLGADRRDGKVVVLD